MIKELENLDIINNISNYKPTKNAFNKIYIYYYENEIIGYIDYSIMYEQAELNYIFIKEKYRNMGYAKKLIEYMLNDLIEKNIQSITLEVSCKNTKAKNLYQKYEFKKIGIREKYYNGIDAILMIKRW